MQLTRKIWFDENTEPPKNYIWYKNGTFSEYIDGKWKVVHDLTESRNTEGNNKIYTSIEEIENPQEGDIVFHPDIYELVGTISSENTPIELDTTKVYKIITTESFTGIATAPAAYEWSSPNIISINLNENQEQSISGCFKIECITGNANIFELTVLLENKEYHNGEWIERDNLFELIQKVNTIENNCQNVYTVPITERYSIGNTIKIGDIVTFTDNVHELHIGDRFLEYTYPPIDRYFEFSLSNVQMILMTKPQNAAISTITLTYGSGYNNDTVKLKIEPYWMENASSGSSEWWLYIYDQYNNVISTVNSYCSIRIPASSYMTMNTYTLRETIVEPIDDAPQLKLSDYISFNLVTRDNGTYIKAPSSISSDGLQKLNLNNPYIYSGSLAGFTLNSSLANAFAEGIFNGIVIDNTYYKTDCAYYNPNTNEGFVSFAKRLYKYVDGQTTETFISGILTLTEVPTIEMVDESDLINIGLTSDNIDLISKGLISSILIGNNLYPIKAFAGDNISLNNSYRNYRLSFGQYNIDSSFNASTNSNLITVTTN